MSITHLLSHSTSLSSALALLWRTPALPLRPATGRGSRAWEEWIRDLHSRSSQAPAVTSDWLLQLLKDPQFSLAAGTSGYTTPCKSCSPSWIPVVPGQIGRCFCLTHSLKFWMWNWHFPGSPGVRAPHFHHRVQSLVRNSGPTCQAARPKDLKK